MRWGSSWWKRKSALFIGFSLTLIFIALLELGIEFTAVSCSVKGLPEGFVVTGNKGQSKVTLSLLAVES